MQCEKVFRVAHENYCAGTAAAGHNPAVGKKGEGHGAAHRRDA